MGKDGKVSKGLEFSLACESIEVVLVGLDNAERKFTLREFTGKERDAFMNQMSQSVVIDSEGKVTGFKTFEGLQSGLLARCMYDDADRLVAEEVIQRFPAKVQTELYKVAQRLNGLSGESEELAKNE